MPADGGERGLQEVVQDLEPGGAAEDEPELTEPARGEPFAGWQQLFFGLQVRGDLLGGRLVLWVADEVLGVTAGCLPVGGPVGLVGVGAQGG